MQNIGLLMTYNEEDIIEEVMESNKKYFDTILVLDGSIDRTPEIIRSYDNVKYFIRDQDLYPKRKIKDGARQFLLEKAQELYGCEGWFTLLHGDEIFVDDPNEIAIRAEKARAELVNWHSLYFFLHISQKGTPLDPGKSIQEQILHYSPGGLEIRQFKNKPGIFYNINQHRNLVPYGIRNKALLDFPIFKHYIHRGARQKQYKPAFGQALNIGANGPVPVNDESLYLTQFKPKFKQVSKYDGSFHEFEPGKRPPFFFQWLNWHKYRKVKWRLGGKKKG